MGPLSAVAWWRVSVSQQKLSWSPCWVSEPRVTSSSPSCLGAAVNPTLSGSASLSATLEKCTPHRVISYMHTFGPHKAFSQFTKSILGFVKFSQAKYWFLITVLKEGCDTANSQCVSQAWKSASQAFFLVLNMTTWWLLRRIQKNNVPVWFSICIAVQTTAKIW